MHILLFIILLLIINVVQAQIYTWVDDTGRTHYSDRPPQNIEADQLDSGDHRVSTIGGGGLRAGEREWLQNIEEAAEQERLTRQIEAQNQPPQVNVVTVEQRREDLAPVRYYYSPIQPGYAQYRYLPHNGIGFQLHYGYPPYSDRGHREDNYSVKPNRYKPRHHSKPRRIPKIKASGVDSNRRKTY
jgi:hypothetical protein